MLFSIQQVCSSQRVLHTEFPMCLPLVILFLDIELIKAVNQSDCVEYLPYAKRPKHHVEYSCLRTVYKLINRIHPEADTKV